MAFPCSLRRKEILDFTAVTVQVDGPKTILNELMHFKSKAITFFL